MHITVQEALDYMIIFCVVLTWVGKPGVLQSMDIHDTMDTTEQLD